MMTIRLFWLCSILDSLADWLAALAELLVGWVQFVSWMFDWMAGCAVLSVILGKMLSTYHTIELRCKWILYAMHASVNIYMFVCWKYYSVCLTDNMAFGFNVVAIAVFVFVLLVDFSFFFFSLIFPLFLLRCCAYFLVLA